MKVYNEFRIFGCFFFDDVVNKFIVVLVFRRGSCEIFMGKEVFVINKCK